jgi:hypothetical protein
MSLCHNVPFWCSLSQFQYKMTVASLICREFGSPRPILALSPMIDPTGWEFRHTPSCQLPLAWHCPSSLEAQALSTQSVLLDIWIWLQPFLDHDSCAALLATTSHFHLGVEYSHLWLYRPWPPLRHQCWGFGTPCKPCTATHNDATYHNIICFVWTYLAPSDRQSAT